MRFHLCSIASLASRLILGRLFVPFHLSRYSIIVIDEAHERSISTDVLLGSIKRIQRLRKAEDSTLPPLKVVVMSATLDAERFSDFFNKCPILYVRGRQHAVKVYHAMEDPEDYVDAVVRTVLQILVRPGKGDILVFLTGQEDIDSCSSTISHLLTLLPSDSTNVQVLQFMASTPPALQAKVFVPSPEGTRKVILSTNVAETSITVPGVTVVVDAGFAKEKGYLSKRGAGQSCSHARQVPSLLTSSNVTSCRYRDTLDDSNQQVCCSAANGTSRTRGNYSAFRPISSQN